MDGIQAAILDVKLTKLREWTKERRRIASRYHDSLKEKNVTLLKSYPGEESVYHLFVVEVDERDLVQDKMKEAGISTGIHYPIALAEQPAVKKLGKKFDTPVSIEKSKRILSLPIFPYMKEEEQDYVIESFLRSIH